MTDKMKKICDDLQYYAYMNSIKPGWYKVGHFTPTDFAKVLAIEGVTDEATTNEAIEAIDNLVNSFRFYDPRISTYNLP